MNNAINFSAKTIQSLPRPQSGNLASEYRSIKNPRHRLLVHQHRTTFSVRVCWKGKRYYKTLGTFPEMTVAQAAKLADEYIYDVQSGAVSKGTDLTIQDFYSKHMLGHSRAHHKDHKGYVSRANVLLPVFGQIKLVDLSPLLITEKLAFFKGRSPATLNRYKAWLSALLKLAARLEIIQTNPCSKVETLPENNHRDRVMSSAESQSFWDCSKLDKNRLHANALLLSLVTGMRIGNVISLKREMLRPDLVALTLPVTKSGRAQTIPLNSVAQDLIRECLDLANSDYVFPSLRDAHGHIGIPRACFARITGAMLNRGALSEPLKIHDLRRTFASTQIGVTGDIRLVQQSLGHSSAVVTERYAYHQISDLAKASESTVKALLKNCD